MRMCQWVGVAVIVMAAGCGNTTGPTSAVVTVAASPPQSAVCTGCGAGSTDREVTATLTIQETAGVAATVTAIEVSLRDQTNAVIASGTFDGAAVTQLAGSNRVPARGTLGVRVGVHYGAGQAGRAGMMSYTVRVSDERGNQLSQVVTAPVTM
jgi:hypothetical protein